jgi:hypothetical protein
VVSLGYAARVATTATGTSLSTLKRDPMGSQEISNDVALLRRLYESGWRGSGLALSVVVAIASMHEVIVDR